MNENRRLEQQDFHVYLLVSLVFLLLIFPIVEHTEIGGGLLRVGITAVLVTAIVAAGRRRLLLWLGLVVVSIAAPLSWTTLFLDQPLLFVLTCALDGAFFVMMAVLLLNTVIRKHLATLNSIFGAISAYLLLGLAWGVWYWGIDTYNPEALDIKHLITDTVMKDNTPTEVASFAQYIYFSFVTMSTLGYGDITPQTPVAQTLTWSQSVVGQFYIAVLVAWLVSEIPRRREQMSG